MSPARRSPRIRRVWYAASQYAYHDGVAGRSSILLHNPGRMFTPQIRLSIRPLLHQGELPAANIPKKSDSLLCRGPGIQFISACWLTIRVLIRDLRECFRGCWIARPP